MIDPAADELYLNLAGRQFSIKQSPGLLQSSKDEGTTGAAVWQTSVRLAPWLAAPDNVLFRYEIIGKDSTVLELGSGAGSIVPCVLAPRVGKVIATDQQHVLKLLRANVDKNTAENIDDRGRRPDKRQVHDKIQIFALDWEEDDVPKQLASKGLTDGVDLVVASDCLYNYALIGPFVQTCVDICSLRKFAAGDDSERATVCLIAQHLRQAEVFEEWLTLAMKSFRIWRMPRELLSDGLEGSSGFAVHVGILR